MGNDGYEYQVGWPKESVVFVNTTDSINDDIRNKQGRLLLTDDSDKLMKADLDGIVEATGTVMEVSF